MKNSDSKTMSQQCSSSPHLLLLSFLSLPCLVLSLAHPRLPFEEEGREGVCRQRDLSASLPRPALGLTGAAEEWGQPKGLTQRSLDPVYSMALHACERMCVWRRKVRVGSRGESPGEHLSQIIERGRTEKRSELRSGVPGRSITHGEGVQDTEH